MVHAYCTECSWQGEVDGFDSACPECEGLLVLDPEYDEASDSPDFKDIFRYVAR